MSKQLGEGVLFIRLEGAFQSWGDNSRWTVRRTRGEPSKSGVIGLLAAVSGYGLDPEGDAEIAQLGRDLKLGVRADRPGTLLRDYHTVCGGVLSAEGKVKRNASTGEPETVVSERYYLADACFLAALVGPEETLHRVRTALEDPVWCPFLGRKNCPPSTPIWPAVPGRTVVEQFRSFEEALVGFPSLRRTTDPTADEAPYSAVWELVPGAAPPERGVRMPRLDVPVSLRRRQFGLRYVCEVPLKGVVV